MKLELKICERCGRLWFRPERKRWAFCGGCLRKVRELPPVKQVPGTECRLPDDESASPADLPLVPKT